MAGNQRWITNPTKAGLDVIFDIPATTTGSTTYWSNTNKAWESTTTLKVDAVANEITVGNSTAKLGFFGKAPVVRPTALTAADNSSLVVVSILGISVLGDGSSTVINNIRTRVNEMETRDKSLGTLPP